MVRQQINELVPQRLEETDPVLARIGRPRDIADGPSPSGQAAAAGALLTYAALTGSQPHRQGAERTLAEPLALAAAHPRPAGWALVVAAAVLDGPRDVAVVGPADAQATLDLRRVAVRATAPGAVHIFGPGQPAGGDEPSRLPLLADRGLVDGASAAYVCRGFVCDRPTTDPISLAELLTR